MSRTRKRNDPYRGTELKLKCPRHGYCSWCDRNRQHNKLKTDANSADALREANSADHWSDLIYDTE